MSGRLWRLRRLFIPVVGMREEVSKRGTTSLLSLPGCMRGAPRPAPPRQSRGDAPLGQQERQSPTITIGVAFRSDGSERRVIGAPAIANPAISDGATRRIVPKLRIAHGSLGKTRSWRRVDRPIGGRS